MNTDRITITQEFTLTIKGATIKLTKDEARSLRDELDAMLDDKPRAIPQMSLAHQIASIAYPQPAVYPSGNPFSPFTPVDPRGPTCAVPTDAEVTNALATR